jgi:hypothetical protein
VFIADRSNRRIRYIDSGGIINTYAGFGLSGGSAAENTPATSRQFQGPYDVKGDKVLTLSLSLSRSHSRSLALSVSLSLSRSLSLSLSLSVCVILGDQLGNIYVSDSLKIFRIDTSASHLVTTLVGSGSSGSVLGISYPSDPAGQMSGLWVESQSEETKFYIAESGSHLVKESISLPTSLPSSFPSSVPSAIPTNPSSLPSAFPSSSPSGLPSCSPSSVPSSPPSSLPSSVPTDGSSSSPSAFPSSVPSSYPSSNPSSRSSGSPSSEPTSRSLSPQLPVTPVFRPSSSPSSHSSSQPISSPSLHPSSGSTSSPSLVTLSPNAADPIVRLEGILVINNVRGEPLTNRSLAVISTAFVNISGNPQEMGIAGSDSSSVGLVSPYRRYKVSFLVSYDPLYHPGYDSSELASLKIALIEGAVGNGSYQSILRRFAVVDNATQLLNATCSEVTVDVSVSEDQSGGGGGSSSSSQAGSSATIGIAIGVVVGVIAVAGLFYLCVSRRGKKIQNIQNIEK